MIRSTIIGLGSYLPANRVTNRELESRVDTSDAWIVERTGIHARHIAADGEFTSDLAAAAGKQALENADVAPSDVDLILVATTTPDETLPATAVKVQHRLGATRAASFDMQAACTGFVYGLATADAYIRSGMARTVLLIAAETFSRIVDWKDRNTCVLFGDGAGAVVMQAGASERGILATTLHADGSLVPILKTNGGVSTTGASGVLTMQGKEVFRHAVGKMAESMVEALKQAGMTLDDVDFIVPHQANIRILSALAEKLNLPSEKLVQTVAHHANTSAASIPLALADLQAEGKLREGMVLALPALGAGLTWGCSIVRW